MKFAVFSHYDIHDLVDDHVMYSLRCYRPYFDFIIFVSTSSLNHAQQQRVLSLADRVIVRRNIGYDFLSWRVGFETIPVDLCSEITFINDSIYGPVNNILEFINKGEALNADLWGASLSRQFGPHIQSFYMTFRKIAISSGFAKTFWSGVDLLPSKNQIIRDYEIGLSAMAEDNGLRIGGVIDLGSPSAAVRQNVFDDNFSSNAIVSENVRNCIFRDKTPNPVQLFWGEVLRCGVPFVKVELMRDNPLMASRTAILNRLKSERWYDYQLILKHLERVMTSPKFSGLMEDLNVS